MEDLNRLSKIVLDKSFEIHRYLGSGLLESVYKEILYQELKNDGFFVEKEVPQPIEYKNMEFSCGYRMDILLERKLVIEVKVVEAIHSKHTSQLLTYLRLGNYKLGLLINFMEDYLKRGIKRMIN